MPGPGPCHHSAVRVLLAPDSFGSSLTAPEAAEALRAGWSSGAPHDEVESCPLADGGPGFLEAIRSSLGGDLVPVTVSGPLGEPVPAVVLVVPESGGAPRTAYVETAQVVGLPLVPPERRDPTRTTTRGVGELLVHARGTGATRVVVGLGGSSTNDGGAGMLVGLGLPDPRGVLGGGGGALAGLRREDLAGLAGLRREWREVELVVGCDVDVPLLGLQGASAGFAPQKGASAQQAQELEAALAHLSRVVGESLADEVRGDLLSGASGAVRLAAAPGAGAAGGLGFGLAALGGRLVGGAALVADVVGLDRRIEAADLVVTGEGRFDWQSLHGKVVSEVGARALPFAVPVVVVAGEVLVGRHELAEAGLAGAYAVAETADEVARALADPATTLRERATRVARTWSPPGR